MTYNLRVSHEAVARVKESHLAFAPVDEHVRDQRAPLDVLPHLTEKKKEGRMCLHT